VATRVSIPTMRSSLACVVVAVVPEDTEVPDPLLDAVLSSGEEVAMPLYS
jgi:hypothetical protein